MQPEISPSSLRKEPNFRKQFVSFENTDKSLILNYTGRIQKHQGKDSMSLKKT